MEQRGDIIFIFFSSFFFFFETNFFFTLYKYSERSYVFSWFSSQFSYVHISKISFLFPFYFLFTLCSFNLLGLIDYTSLNATNCYVRSLVLHSCLYHFFCLHYVWFCILAVVCKLFWFLFLHWLNVIAIFLHLYKLKDYTCPYLTNSFCDISDSHISIFS